MTAPDRFRFLGEERSLAGGGWDDPGVEKLWRYNLHYFADLTSTDAGSRAAWHGDLIERWIRENPPGAGTGWDPYPTSLRIVNWVKWALAGNRLSPAAEQSLAIQARWLSRRLERHLLGNHLFVNAKALCFAGAWFAGPEANAWRSLGAEVLGEEMPEQILADGGQFERSPMYHALALEDVLDLCNLARVVGDDDAILRGVATAARARVAAMRHWLAVMTHPDEEIGFFNDAAFDIAPSGRALEAYGVRLGFPAAAPLPAGLTRLEPSGYARLANADAVVLVDVGPVGPAYLPGHAHADTLSFELSVGRQRVIVNSGTSRYGVGDERLRQRGTAAHNTVVVDGHDSSEVWDGFRVGRRAHPLDVRTGSGPVSLTAAHDGYRYLPGSPVHRRGWTLLPHVLVITDEVQGGAHHAEARLHLHPAVEPLPVMTDAPGEIALRLPDGRILGLRVEGATLAMEPATWHPRFGTSVATRCLVATLDGASLRTEISWGQP